MLKVKKNTMHLKRSKVQGLVIQREGISTQCICGTPQEPFEISILVEIVCLVKMGVDEILKIRQSSVENLT